MNRENITCIAYICAGLLFAAAPLVAQSSDQEPSTIVVSGEGEIKVTPDEAMIPLVVRTEGLEVEEAKKENDRLVKEIQRLAMRVGIPQDQVHVDYMNISQQHQVSDEYPGIAPRFRKDDGAEKSLGYVVARNVIMQLKDLKRFEELLAESVKLKSVYLGPVQIRSSDAEKHREQARLKAIRAAKEKAAMMAGELGTKLGKPLSITEGSYYADEYGEKVAGGGAPGYYAAVSGYGGEMGTISSPGQLSFSTRVMVVFEIQ